MGHTPLRHRAVRERPLSRDTDRQTHAGHDSQDSAAALETLLDGERPALRVLAGEEPDDPGDETAAEGGDR